MLTVFTTLGRLTVVAQLLSRLSVTARPILWQWSHRAPYEVDALQRQGAVGRVPLIGAVKGVGEEHRAEHHDGERGALTRREAESEGRAPSRPSRPCTA